MKNLLNEIIDSNAWRTSLVTYAYIMSGGQWRPWKHLVYIANEIEKAIREGDGRLIINSPPRHGKSQLISKWLPIWFLDMFPEKRVVLATSTMSLAKDLGRFVRDFFSISDLSLTKLRKDVRSVSSWKTLESDEGGMYCVGVGGDIIGRGGDLIIIDDPHKSWQDALSIVKCDAVYDWFTKTIYHRKEPKGTILINQTRWTDYDLTGQCLDKLKHENWKHICLSCVAEENDLLNRNVGDVLCSARLNKKDIKNIKLTLGKAFDAIFQQRPTALEGNIIKAEWINFYDELPGDLEFFIQSWDLTFVKKGTSKVCGMVWAHQPQTNNKYLIDMVYKNMSFVESQYEIKKMIRLWDCSKKNIVIENKANGPAIMSQLKNEIPGLISFEPKGDKDSRFSAVAPLFENGKIFVPSDKDWVSGLITEWVSIPNYPDRDRTDATSQALLYYQKKLRQKNVFDIKISSKDSYNGKSMWEYGHVY